MKRVIFLIAALLIIGSVNAQDGDHKGFAEGDMFVSGSVGYHSISHSDDSKEKKFNLTPRFGYFLNDFIAVGGRLSFQYNDHKTGSGQKTAENTTYSIGVFGRYYLLPGSKFSVFGELGVGFGATRNHNHDWTNGVNATFAPGLSYFLGHHFALEASFGILSYETVSTDGQNGSTDSFDIGLDLEHINFGIIYKF